MAYHRTPGALKRARVEIDRATGHVTVWATELDEDDTPIGEFDDTPNGFGRVAASTARSCRCPTHASVCSAVSSPAAASASPAC